MSRPLVVRHVAVGNPDPYIYDPYNRHFLKSNISLMPPKRLCACRCGKYVCKTTQQNHLQGNAHMSLSSRVLAQNAQLLPSLKRKSTSTTSFSCQKKKKKTISPGSASTFLTLNTSLGTSELVEAADGSLDRSFMEADGPQPLTSSINEAIQPSSGLQPATGLLRASQDLTPDAVPSASQQLMQATVHLERLAQQHWGSETPGVDFDIQEETNESNESDMEELDKASDKTEDEETEDEEMEDEEMEDEETEDEETEDEETEEEEAEQEDNDYWDEVTNVGMSISASDCLDEHFIREAMSIGMNSFVNKVHVADVLDSTTTISQ